MNCTEYSVLLEKYLDGSLTLAEDAELRRHEEICPACAAQRRALDSLQDDLHCLKDDVPPVPEDFHQAWTTLVEEDAMENREHKPRIRTSWTRILSTAAALVFVLGGTLLTRDALSPRTAAQTDNTNASIYGYAMKESYDAGAANVMLSSAVYDEAAETGTSGSAYTRSAKMTAATDTAAVQQEQKIIRSASLTIGTQTYDESLASLRQLCEESGGWISYSSESVSTSGARRAYLSLRIPADQLDACLAGSSSLGRVISRDESATDVTASYYDTQARLDTQLALMERLQALMTDAATLADLLALESQIADTQYQIDSLRSILASTDRQVDYATVDVNLREETAATDITDGDKTLGERLLSALETGLAAFVDFAADMMVFLTAALPFILIAAAVWLVARILRKRRK